MKHKGVYDFMGEGNFVWFTGIIEDIHDPMEAGRVKVRCFGFHTHKKSDIKTEHLPWALVVSPTTSASVSGIGSTPHGLVQGSQVLGFFRDGSNGQHPIITGSIPGIPKEAANPERGFNDPDGVYPREDRINHPDVNQLAGSSHAESDFRSSRTDNLILDIPTADGDTWSEPDSLATPTYPNNHVIETTAGHVIEIDNSTGSERIHLRHMSGSYIEILADGSVSKKTLGNESQIVTGDQNLLVNGDINVNTDAYANIKIQDNLTVRVENGNIVIVVQDGNATLDIHGDVDAAIFGDMTSTVSGNMTQNVEKDMNITVEGEYNVTAKGKVKIRGSRIDLN